MPRLRDIEYENPTDPLGRPLRAPLRHLLGHLLDALLRAPPGAPLRALLRDPLHALLRNLLRDLVRHLLRDPVHDPLGALLRRPLDAPVRRPPDALVRGPGNGSFRIQVRNADQSSPCARQLRLDFIEWNEWMNPAKGNRWRLREVALNSGETRYRATTSLRVRLVPAEVMM